MAPKLITEIDLKDTCGFSCLLPYLTALTTIAPTYLLPRMDMESSKMLYLFQRLKMDDDDNQQNSPQAPVLESRNDIIERIKYRRTRLLAGQHPASPVDPEHEWRVVGQPKWYSSTSIEQLERINVEDMVAPKVHKRKYLICRVIYAPARQVSVELAVEDPFGTGIILTIDNYPGLFQANLSTLDDQFPCGTVIAVREPWMKLSMSEHWAFVRVDSPSDIMILGNTDLLGQPIIWATAPTWPEDPSTMTGWKERGNNYYKRESFLPAAQAWTRALELEPENVDLLLNRSMAYLRLEWPGAAQADAVRVLSLTESTMIINKAEYRAASAEYIMGKYATALERFMRLLRSGQNTEEIHNWQARCKYRMIETKGTYNWKEIYDASKKKNQHPDVAEFVGPVEVASMPHRGGGRGLRALRDIKAGDLLIVSRGITAVFPNDGIGKTPIQAIHHATKYQTRPIEVALIAAVMAKLHGCPDQSHLVLDLFSGDAQDNSPSTYPRVSACPPCLLDPRKSSLNIDTTRIDQISYHNFFGGMSMDVASLARPEKDPPTMFVSLQHISSLLNHSCMPNATWRLFGAVMVVRSNRDIVRGTELTIAYTAPSGTAETRCKALEHMLDKPCDCELCDWDRKDGETVWVSRKKFESLDLRCSVDADALEKVIIEATATYPANHIGFRVMMVDLHDEAMQFYQQKLIRAAETRLPLSAIRTIHEGIIRHGILAVQATGIIVVTGGSTHKHTLPISKSCLPPNTAIQEQVIFIITQLAASFLMIGKMKDAHRWFRAAWFVHESTVGGGRALFNLRYRSAVNWHKSFDEINYRWE